MPIVKKTHKLNIGTSGYSSRFLVDLATKIKKEEKLLLKKIEKDKNKFSFRKFLNKFSFGNILRALKNFLPHFSNYYYFFFHKKYKKLSFYFLFNLLCKLSYATGWLFVFGIRLFFVFFILSYRKASDKLITYRAFKKKMQVEKISYLQSLPMIKKTASKEVLSLKKDSHRWTGNVKDKLPLVKRISLFFTFRNFQKIIPSWRFSFVKQAIIFSVLLLALIFPLKAFLQYYDFLKFRGEVLGVSASAVDSLRKSSNDVSDLKFDEAVKNFAKASSDFKIAQTELSSINGVFDTLAKVLPNKNLKLAAQADLFLRAGELTASIANRIGSSLDLFETQNLKISNVLNIVYDNLNSSNAEIVELGEILKKIDLNTLPDEYRERVSLFQESSIDISGLFAETTALIDGTRKIFGFDQDRRYLVIFQNNTEMRGSGGFVGSYALADFHNGEMISLEVPSGGSYDTEAGYLERVAAPEPLQLVNPLWHFWDANWWPDWAMSAKKLMWFYEKSNGPTVDGVIALTPNVMSDLLKIIGPLDLTARYGVVINSDNFWDVVQDVVEEKPELIFVPSLKLATSSLLKVDKIKPEPKKIIGDMLDLIIDKTAKELNRQDFLSILNVVYQNLNEKHILTYFVDENLQKLVSDFKWTGLMEDVDGDYLMVANSNIAGAKTDKMIKENISLLRTVQTDGSIVNTLTIQRRHIAIRGEEFVGVRNVNWLRVYVPAGSELLSAEGFSQPDSVFFEKPATDWKKDKDILRGEDDFIIDTQSNTKIYQELGKTVFANWSMVDPGEQVLITIKYRLPFEIKANSESVAENFWEKLITKNDLFDYVPLKLLVQKQPGSQGSEFVSNLVLPSNMKIAWQNNNSLNYRNKLNIDRNWFLLLEVAK